MINIKKLTPYLSTLTPKYKLIIYLLATGNYNFNDVRFLKKEELTKHCSKKIIKDIGLIDICHDICDTKQKNKKVFFNPSGRNYSESYILSVLERSHKIANETYVSRNHFVKNVNK